MCVGGWVWVGVGVGVSVCVGVHDRKRMWASTWAVFASMCLGVSC